MTRHLALGGAMLAALLVGCGVERAPRLVVARAHLGGDAVYALASGVYQRRDGTPDVAACARVCPAPAARERLVECAVLALAEPLQRRRDEGATLCSYR